MSDIIEKENLMKQVAVSRYSGPGTLIFSNISEDDPRFMRGTAPVRINAVITDFHIEYPMGAEESGAERRPYVLVDAEIESIEGPIGGFNRTLSFAEYDAQKFSFYYPIPNQELINMISDGLYDYKTFAGNLAAQMKDEYRELTFSCEMDYTLFLKTAGDFESKQVLVCDPVAIFHDRSFLDTAADFIPPGIQDNEKITSFTFHLDEASEAAHNMSAETEEISVKDVNEVKVRNIEDMLDDILTQDEIENILNEKDDDDWVPDNSLFEDEDDYTEPLPYEGSIFTETDIEPMADGPVPTLLEEDEPEQNVPAVSSFEEELGNKKSEFDTIVVSKGDELEKSVEMIEAEKEVENLSSLDKDIDELFADLEDSGFAVEVDGDNIVTSKEAVEEQVELDMINTTAVSLEELEAAGEELQEKAEEKGLITEEEDEDALFLNE